MRTSLILAAFALVLSPPALLGQEGASVDTVTTLHGVFTEGQVQRGERVFQDSCLECHDTFEFVESGFMKSWAGQPLLELFDYVSTMMPDDNPGSLRSREYSEVFAYLFHLNGMPTGERRLEADKEFLRRLIIALPEKSDGPSRRSDGSHP